MFEALKGEGKSLVVCKTMRGVYELQRFVDGSWGIRLDDRLVDLFEHDQRDECMRAFMQMANVDVSSQVVIFKVPRGTISQMLEEQPSVN